MKLLRWFLFLLSISGMVDTAFAQGPSGGNLVATDFNNWAIGGQSIANGTAQWFPGSVCTVNSNGYSFVPFKVGSPVKIVDATPANTEQISPSTVTINATGCTVVATMAYTHYSYQITSATAGLQEAINYLGAGSGVVVLTAQWAQAGGTTGMITGALGSTNISILDQRTSAAVSYTWNGSAYVVGGSGAKYIIGTTVSALPAASSSANNVWTIHDGTSATDCTVGGGSTQVLCYSDGASWTA